MGRLLRLPPVPAWIIAVILTPIALIMIAHVVAPPQEAIEGEKLPPQEFSLGDIATYLALLILPVGLTPVVARTKGSRPIRWTAAIAGVAVAQVLTAPVLGPIIHPLTPFIALLIMRRSYANEGIPTTADLSIPLEEPISVDSSASSIEQPPTGPVGPEEQEEQQPGRLGQQDLRSVRPRRRQQRRSRW